MKNMDQVEPGGKQWRKSYDFLFAVIGCSVGLGNVWRFPYLCFKNGGGAFLIPYTIFVIGLGIPLIILETSLGQKIQGGLKKCWETVPLFKGIYLANMVIFFHGNAYYAVLMAWMLKYLVACFSKTLPWSHCHNDWNSKMCIAPNQVNFTNESHTSSAEEYWRHEVLGISGGITNMGSFRKDLVLYLAITWTAAYFSTFKGIQWTVKIVYVTATLPFLLIATILIRGVTLDGASEGIIYYLSPNVTKLGDPEVWVSAGAQVMFSYSTATGILVTLSSLNTINTNFWQNACLIGAFNSITSFVSGFAIFSTLGFMAKLRNTTVDQVASSGPGLAFVAYPEALSLMPIPQLWSVLFFLTLLSLGFDSLFVFQECLLEAFMDTFVKLRWSREAIQFGFCVILFLIGLPMLTEGGVYIFEMYNNYAIAGWSIFFIGMCEMIAIAWFYGMDKYWKEIEIMIGKQRGKIWITILWKYLSPTVCCVVTGYYLSTTSTLKYENYVYPMWAQLVAHMISLSSVIMIPAYTAFYVIKSCRNGGFREILATFPASTAFNERLFSKYIKNAR